MFKNLDDIKKINDIKELIPEINRMNELSKNKTLSSQEKEYQKELRNRFIALKREDILQHLSTIKIVDEDGNDITPTKLKELKKEKSNEQK